MDKCFQEKPGCCCAYFPPKLLENTFPRLHIAFYECHMARWRAVFPPENILELTGYIDEKNLRKVFNFLNLPVEPVWNKTVFGNENHRAHDPVNDGIKKELKAFFARHNASELVEKHIGGFAMPALTSFCKEPIFRNDKFHPKFRFSGAGTVPGMSGKLADGKLARSAAGKRASIEDIKESTKTIQTKSNAAHNNRRL
jgi:hypothetical protein